MKAYVILLKDKDVDEYPAVSNYLIDGLPLYGITNRKEYLKSFINTRDMSKFTIKKFIVESDNDYDNFIDRNDINTYELTTSAFPTTTEFNDWYMVGYAKIVCTIKESDSVEYDYDSYLLDKVEEISTGIFDIMKNDYNGNLDKMVFVDYIKEYTKLFNESIQKALDYLGFMDFMEDALYQLDNIDSSEYNLGEDKLRVYCKMFGNTYKEI